MGAAAMALSAAGAGVQIAGQIQQGNSANAAAKYNAAMSMNNAQIATQNANWAAAEGAIRNEQQGLESRAGEGALLANQAASGVDIGSASAADVRASEHTANMMDALTLRTKAAREAYGYQTEAVDQTAQAALQRAEGKQALKASRIAAAGTLLSAAGNMASKTGSGGGTSNYDSWRASKTFLSQPGTRIS